MPIRKEKQKQEGSLGKLRHLTSFHCLATGALLSLVLFAMFSLVNAATLTAGDLAARGSPDGQLDAGDLLILQQFVIGTQTPVGNESLVADVAPLGSPDGQINAGDVVVLMRAINGEVTLPPVVVAPAAPVLDSLSSPTNNNPQTITGTAPPNTEVRVNVNGVQQDTVMSNAGGLFSFQAILIDGINSIRATTWDGADESGDSNVLSLDYINTIPRSQSGTITQDTVWTPGASIAPYVIDGNLTIANGASLILLPGVEVQFPENYTIRVDGELKVLGSAAKPVKFTSNRTSPAADDWQGILVLSAATRVVIDYAEIRYANRGIDFSASTLLDTGACDTLCVRDSTIENNNTGVYVNDANPSLQCNRIQNNLNEDIFIDYASPLADARESAADYVRPFGPDAPWNIPVANLPRHPESDLYASRLYNYAPDRPGNFNVGSWEHTYPVYYVPDATTTYTVNGGYDTPDGTINGIELPWNPHWSPAAGTDGQVILLDPPTGREWDLWRVSISGTTITVVGGSLVPGSYHTRTDGWSYSRGIGIQYLAMLGRPEEITQGEIRHALSMTIRNPSKTFYVAPATKLEHPGTEIANPIPEGMRFALDVTDAQIESWVATKPAAYRKLARIVARALRDYGWFITDTGGSANLQFEAEASAKALWKAQCIDPVSTTTRDLLDGLMTQSRIYAIVPSDQYPN